MGLVPGIRRPSTPVASGALPAASSASLPDINAETYPFDVVQKLLDQAAYYSVYSTPDLLRSRPIMDAGGSNIIGFQVVELIHRFSITMRPPTTQGGFTAWTMLGEQIGRFEHRWLFIPDSFAALPDSQPPPTKFDPALPQRFAMFDSRFFLGNGADGFRGFGTGSTFPAVIDGRKQVLAGAVGTILEGFGRFAGHEAAYTYGGSLSPRRGFMGSLVCRVVDPSHSLYTDTDLQPMRPMADPEPGITYLIFRGQKKDKTQKTEYVFAPGGQVTGLNVTQQLRMIQIDCGFYGKGISAWAKVGPVIGEMTAQISFNLLNPGAPGTGTSPIPFKSYNTYRFVDPQGREVGSIEANGGEGRTFRLDLAGAPGQQALRFGGFGPITKGTGWFKGIEGFMTDNSVVGIAPHALATLYVLRVHDPDGKYRTMSTIGT